MNERQKTNAVDPAAVPPPKGFRRLEQGELLRKGDLFLHCVTLDWLPASTVPVQENYYTNCIRPTGPIALLAEHCS